MLHYNIKTVLVLMQDEINSKVKTAGYMFQRDKGGNDCSSAIHLSHSATGSASNVSFLRIKSQGSSLMKVTLTQFDITIT
jgi:hypothetical protein